MEINVKKGKILEGDSNMNKDERTIFWNALLEARNLKDIEKVYATIKLPKFVYRYRAVNEYSLSALGKNELFFSTSNYYDDPFDTYFHINWDMPKKMATALNNGTVPEPMFSGNEYLRSQVAKAKGTDLTGATENVIGYLKEIRNDMRKNTWSICFSESFDNENLWLKYADRHKGFVMEYEVKQLLEGDMRVIGCGLCANCKNNSLKAAKTLNINTIALAGGVSANSYIRGRFLELEKTENMKIYYPELILCTDNAAMIASAGYYNYINGIKSNLELNAIPNLKIGD